MIKFVLGNQNIDYVTCNNVNIGEHKRGGIIMRRVIKNVLYYTTNKYKAQIHHIKYFILYKFSALSLYIYIYIYNQPLCPPSILITGWWSSIPRAESRGALLSVPKIKFSAVPPPPYPPTNLIRIHQVCLILPLHPVRLLSRQLHLLQFQAVLLPPPLGRP